MHNVSDGGRMQFSHEPKRESNKKEVTSFSMLRARALVIGPLGACGGDGVSVRVVEGCSASHTYQYL